MISAGASPDPVLSVILPVYNGLAYLEAAVDSVLNQTFRNFELIIINDGSTDGSGDWLQKLTDPRIRYYQQPNKGLAATLNRAIGLSRGQYIARQDQDDVCMPQRMERQVQFLDTNPEVGMVGTAAEIWEGNQRTSRQLAHPAADVLLRFGLLFENYFVHSSVMIRRAVLDKVGGYSEDRSRQPPEDYELWSRVMREYRVANLPEVLMAYREVPGSMSRTGGNPFLPNLIKISAENIAWASGIPVDSIEVSAVSRLSHGVYDQIPHGTAFSRLQAVLQQAAHGIAVDAGGAAPQLDALLRRRILQLRYHYLNFRCGGLIGKLLNNRAGSVAKRVAKRIF